MMRNRLWILAAAAMMAACFASSPARAQNDEAAPKKDDAAAAPAEGEKQGERRRSRAERTPREMLAAVHKLHETLKKELVLTESMQKEIDELFKGYVEQFREVEGDEAEKQEQARRERLDAIRDELRAAREAGDQDKLRALRTEMVDLRRQLYQPKPFEEAARLVEEVAGKLEGEQRSKFQKMAQRLGVAPPANRRGPLADVTLILRDPDIGITPEQNAEIRRIIREIMTENRELGRDEAGREELGKRIEAAVLKELTPAQAAKYREKKAQAQEAQNDAGGRLDARAGKRNRDKE